MSRLFVRMSVYENEALPPLREASPRRTTRMRDVWDADPQEKRRTVLLAGMSESCEQEVGEEACEKVMTQATTKPDKWAQFSDRELIELYCRKTNGLPSHHLGTPRAELIELIERPR